VLESESPTKKVQRSTAAVDRPGVRAMFLWLGVGLGAASGHVVGWIVAPGGLHAIALAGWVTVVASAALIAVLATIKPGLVSATGFVMVGLAGLIGLEAARAHRTAHWPAAERGPAQGLRELEIVGASSTGRACEVAAREPGDGVRVWLSAPPEACPLADGQRVVVLAAKMRFSEGVQLPGGIDPRRMAMARGAALALRVDALWTVEASSSAYWRWVAEARDRAWTWTRGDDAASFVVASALGIRVALAPQRRAEVRRAGLGHLIAVSGLHVALAAWFVHAASVRVAALLGRAPAWGVVVSWVPLIGYVGLTGASPPAVRAACMLVLFGLGSVVGRPAHGLHLLAVAASTMLLARPAWALDPGFQLSLAAMAALVRAPADTGLLGHSWRISWAILPVSAIHFDETGAYSVISNLVAIPVFTTWVLPAALLGWLLTPWLGPVALLPAAAGAEIVLDLSAAIAALPSVSLGAATLVAAIGLGLRAWARHRALRRLCPPWLASLATIAAWLWSVTRPAVDPGPWLAVGKPRAHAVVAVVADEEGDRFGCLRGSVLSASAWMRTFDALGIDRVAAVQPAVLTMPEDAPHLHALRTAFRRERRWGGDAEACRYPGAERVSDALERCSRRNGGGRAVVLGPMDQGALRCFVGGRFEPLRVRHGAQE
jgi:ComEC/Rec2-related protein